MAVFDEISCVQQFFQARARVQARGACARVQTRGACAYVQALGARERGRRQVRLTNSRNELLEYVKMNILLANTSYENMIPYLS